MRTPQTRRRFVGSIAAAASVGLIGAPDARAAEGRLYPTCDPLDWSWGMAGMGARVRAGVTAAG
jgi:hypothetical protein